jgi:succinoglycan biosynthesis transport protein ExoP
MESCPASVCRFKKGGTLDTDTHVLSVLPSVVGWGEDVMEPMEHLVAVRRSWRVIALLTVLGLAVGLVVAFAQAPGYRARASVLLAPRGVVQEAELGQINSFITAHVHSYAELASSPKVLEPVLKENDMAISTESFSEQLSAEVPIDTQVIEINVVDPDPGRAAALANSIARHLTTTVSEVAPLNATGAPSVGLKTVGVAAPPQHTDTPSRVALLAVGAGGGLLLGLLYAIARHGVTMRRTASSASRP